MAILPWAIKVGLTFLYEGEKVTVTKFGSIPDRCSCGTHTEWSNGNGACAGFFKRKDVIADAPAVAPVAADRMRPPTGYAECTKKCGRWTNIGPCWTCRGEADWNPHSRFPDWMPPLAAQPAETKLCGCAGRENCITCRTVPLTVVCMECSTLPRWKGSERDIDAHAAEAHRKPAPQPKPAKGPKTNCLLYGDMGCAHCEPEHGLPCEDIPVIPAEQVCFDCDLSPAIARYVCTGLRMICDDCYLNREKHIGDDQSGAPYTGPERLERPKLAHSHGVEDPTLENA